MRKLELISYNENWVKDFSGESIIIKRIFDSNLLNIYHIGSTSIPGMVAKPVIDILIEVQDINEIDSYTSEMKTLGYIARGENGIKDRRYFVKEKDYKRTHHVHIYQIGAKEIIQHLAFRDYLIEYQHEAEKYKNKKQEISKMHLGDIKLYQEKKSSFVNELTEKALMWANENKKTAVAGFILREKEKSNFELLSLSIQAIPNALWRVPGGGVEKNENLVEALYREIKEETGLTDLVLIRDIGVLHYYKPYIRRIVERHDFLLLAPPDTSDSWHQSVTGEDKDSGMIFEYKWIKANDLINIDGELRSFLTARYIPELFN